MSTKKKILCTILAMGMMLFSIAGCSQSSAPAAPAAPASSAAPAPSAAPAAQASSAAPQLNYPTKPIKIIVPFSAGGTTDLMARALQPQLSKRLGANIVVENHPGGGGAPGMMAVATSPADGYTLVLVSSGPSTLTPNITDVGYTSAEFQPIANIAFNAVGVWARAGEGIETLDDLIRVAKEKPGMTYAGGGAGGDNHIAAELFFNAAGVPGLLTHIPFDSGTEGMTALLGKHVDFAVEDPADYAALAAEGKVINLATTHPVRCSIMPETPTMRELGYDVAYGSWWGFAAPAGTPMEIVELLDGVIKESMEDPEIIEMFKNLSMVIEYGDHVAFTERWMSTYDSNHKMLIELGLSEFKE